MNDFLPLVFANGRFTTFSEMSDLQVEKFLTFLLQYSSRRLQNGDLKVLGQVQVDEPAWWLPDLPFIYPIVRPKKVTRKWRQCLEYLICACYKYYKAESLLELSKELAQHQRNNDIYFIKTRRHTNIYLFDSHKWIAKVTTCNMTYDIYEYPNVCYNYKLKDLDETSSNISSNSTIISNSLPTPLPPPSKNAFLAYFDLESVDEIYKTYRSVSEDSDILTRYNLRNTPSIPFSSEMGRRLYARTKNLPRGEYHSKRLERLARYLSVKPTPLATTKTEFQPAKPNVSTKWMHTYKFPTKTYQRLRLDDAGALIKNSNRKCNVLLNRLNTTINNDTSKEPKITRKFKTSQARKKLPIKSRYSPRILCVRKTRNCIINIK